MSISQKKAVYNAVLSFLKDKGRHFEDFKTVVDLSKDERRTVTEVLMQGFESGEISLSDSAKQTNNTPKKLRNYASGVLSDRLRKDKRLNGDTVAQIKKPGSRAGAGDEIIKELREYKKKHCTTSEQKATADKAIEARLEEIRIANLENTNINMDLVNSYLSKVKDKS